MAESKITKRYSCPLADLERGPTKSIAIRSNGMSIIGIGCKGAHKWGLGLAL